MPLGQSLQLLLDTLTQTLENARHKRRVRDPVALHGRREKLGPKGPLVHHTSPIQERQDHAAHEIHGMVGWEHREVGLVLLHGKQLRKDLSLLQVVVVSEHAALGQATRTGRVDNTGEVLTLPPDVVELPRDRCIERDRAAQIGTPRRLGHHHVHVRQHPSVLGLEVGKDRKLCEQDARASVPEQGKLLRCGELVVKRHEHGPGPERTHPADHPARLVRHQNRKAVPGCEPEALHARCELLGLPPEVEVRKPTNLPMPVRFDERYVALECRSAVTQYLAQGRQATELGNHVASSSPRRAPSRPPMGTASG